MEYTPQSFKQRMAETKDWLSKELANIRTGRASTSILDSVKVESYGSYTQLTHVAAVTIEDAKTVRVAPWDTSTIKGIEKAIQESDLGVSLATDGKGIRVIFPELTSERRQMFVKVAKEKLEGARITVRQARQEAIDDIQGDKKDGKISEDDFERAREEIQKFVDQTNIDLEQLFDKKEKEILE